MAKLFTEEELAELRKIDEELDDDYHLTQEDLQFSRQLDREARLDKLDNRGRKIAAQKAAYYEANKDKIAAQKAAYREANKDKIAEYQAAYREANREKWNAYQREYRRKKREAKKKAALQTRTLEDGTRDIYLSQF